MTIALALCFALFAASAGANNVGRIYNGVNASPGEFGFMVSIEVNNQSSGFAYRCGGFIYNKDWVVTSASCVTGYDLMFIPSEVRVTVGQYSLTQVDPGEATLSVFSININDAPQNATNNIALLETARPIDFVDPVKIGPYNDIDASSEGIIMGWGEWFEGVGGGDGTALTLKKANATISTSSCSPYTTTEFDFRSMICVNVTSPDGASPCKYDEGGPLVQGNSTSGYTVIGIMAKNKGCGTSPIAPSIYFRLSTYYAWFNKVAGPQ